LIGGAGEGEGTVESVDVGGGFSSGRQVEPRFETKGEPKNVKTYYTSRELLNGSIHNLLIING